MRLDLLLVALGSLGLTLMVLELIRRRKLKDERSGFRGWWSRSPRSS
jgi:hypothetical protein